MVGTDSAVLVTGATGFIGRHIVQRLLDAGRRVVVLVRRRAGMTAEARMGEVFGELSDRLELLEGDLAQPFIVENNLTRLRSMVRTVIHCAGETSFLTAAQDSTPMVQIDGPMAFLEMLAARGLRRWCHVSTAFVCGRRSGLVLENQTDVGQEFHNSYERLKLRSEIRFKQACREVRIDLQILRPSIVVGAAPATMGGVPSNLLLAFLKILIGLSLKTAGRNTHVRIHGLPSARFNIVPIEYVAAAIAQLSQDRAASGETFHLVAVNPPTQNAVAEIIRAHLGLRGLRVLGPGEDLSDPSPLERRLGNMLRPYKEYLEQDVQFDCSVARRLLACYDLQPPVIDDRQVGRLIELAWSLS